MSNRQGIEIDYCPQCRGVWLDREELDKITERTVVPQVPSPQPREAHREERGRDNYRGGDGRYNDKGYRKRSSLFDFFDFD